MRNFEEIINELLKLVDSLSLQIPLTGSQQVLLEVLKVEYYSQLMGDF